jgi:hypothetical protein
MNPLQDLVLTLGDASLFVLPALPIEHTLAAADLLAQDIHRLSQFGEMLLERREHRVAAAGPARGRLAMGPAFSLQLERLLLELGQQLPLERQRGRLVRCLGTGVAGRFEGQPQSSRSQIAQHLLGVFNLSIQFVQLANPTGLGRDCRLGLMLNFADGVRAARPEPRLALGQIGLDRLHFRQQPVVFTLQPLQMHPRPPEFLDDRLLTGPLQSCSVVRDAAGLIKVARSLSEQTIRTGSLPQQATTGFNVGNERIDPGCIGPRGGQIDPIPQGQMHQAAE